MVMDYLISDDPRIEIGRFTYGSSPSLKLWLDTDKIKIGSFCSMADGIQIFGGGEHRTNYITSFPLGLAFGISNLGEAFAKGPTIIGNDVWIGSNAMILSGVTIGHGAVIGAGAVIAKDIPPYAIVIGNPSKIIRYRFKEIEIEKLLELRWWDWDIDKIKTNASLLCSEKIDEVLNCK